MAITTSQYQELMLGVLDTIKTNIVEPSSPDSYIETRYIAPNGRDDEQWIAYLRDETGVVDIWLLTFAKMGAFKDEDPQQGPSGTFNKPVSIVIDYHSDYRQGVDVVGDVGSETSTNTEHEFLKKIFAVDLALEKNRNCLQSNIVIRDWDFQLKIRRFETASTHWASGIINLQVQDVFL